MVSYDKVSVSVPAPQLPHAARHSMDSPEWYTPYSIVYCAREVMGAIDLDPASHAEANLTVGAAKFYTEQDDGLTQPWSGRVFLNPPGGKDADGKSLVPQFWSMLVESFFARFIDEAVWVGYSLEQLQTLQSAKTRYTPIDFSICIPRRRIEFVENAAKRAARIEKLVASGKTPNQKSQPSHANYITYMGPNSKKFAQVFDAIGQVVLR